MKASSVTAKALSRIQAYSALRSVVYHVCHSSSNSSLEVYSHVVLI